MLNSIFRKEPTINLLEQGCGIYSTREGGTALVDDITEFEASGFFHPVGFKEVKSPYIWHLNGRASTDGKHGLDLIKKIIEPKEKL